ncbi:MAG: hypothetical protein ISN64_01660 [Rickettsia sp.]|nr:hypothetical protein [Rickettsia sp.]
MKKSLLKKTKHKDNFLKFLKDFKHLYHVENDTSTKLEILEKFNMLIELGIIFPKDFLKRVSNPILSIEHLLRDGNFEMLEFLIDKGLIETKDIVQKTNENSPILDTIIIHNNLEILNKLIFFLKTLIYKDPVKALEFGLKMLYNEGSKIVEIALEKFYPCKIRIIQKEHSCYPIQRLRKAKNYF